MHINVKDESTIKEEDILNVIVDAIEGVLDDKLGAENYITRLDLKTGRIKFARKGENLSFLTIEE